MKKMFVLIAVLLTFAGCTNSPQISSPPDVSVTPGVSGEPTANVMEFAFTEQNFPKIDGSTANIPMIEAVKSVLLGKPRAECVSTVSGTDDAYYALNSNESSVLFVYEASPENYLYSDGSMNTFEFAVIGRDALVFLVNADNPLDNLTTEQVRKIYTGEITDWAEIMGNVNSAGSPAGEIVAYQRQKLSGSQTMMDKLVMNGLPMADAPAELVIAGMGGLVDAVAEYDNAKNAIGYNVYYFVYNMEKNERVKILSIDGVMPSADTIRSGEYPFVNDFYAIIRKSAPDGSPERILFDWIQSDEGMALINNEGYVGIR